MKPTGLLLFMLVGASVIVGIFFVLPAYKDMRSMRATIQKHQQEYETRAAYYATLREVQSRLEERREGVSRLDAAIPKELGLSALYGLLQTMAAESGLVMRSVGSSSVDQSMADVRARQSIISLKLTGTYASLKAFLERMEAAPRFLNVQDVAFLSSKSAAVPFDFSLSLTTYSY